MLYLAPSSPYSFYTSAFMKRLAILASTAVVLALAAPGAASAQTISTPASPSGQAGSIVDYTAQFNQLGGMNVSWTTSDDGGCSLGCSGTFGSLGSGVWGVEGLDFSLKTIGIADSYGLLNPFQWQLKGKYLTGFSIDPAGASAVFDIVNAPDIETPNSSFGRPFQWASCILVVFCSPIDDKWNTTATYTTPVGIGGADPVGDLYAKLDVTFGGGKTFGGSRLATANFSQDLDLVDSRGVILGSVTPEPATMSMMAFGLVGMAGMARRRRRNV
jgi:hypothetical protein